MGPFQIWEVGSFDGQVRPGDSLVVLPHQYPDDHPWEMFPHAAPLPVACPRVPPLKNH